MAKNSGFYYTDPKTGNTMFLIINTASGWYHEYYGGTGTYNNPIAAAFDTGSYAPISASHAGVMKAACESVMNPTLTIELLPADVDEIPIRNEGA